MEEGPENEFEDFLDGEYYYEEEEEDDVYDEDDIDEVEVILTHILLSATSRNGINNRFILINRSFFVLLIRFIAPICHIKKYIKNH